MVINSTVSINFLEPVQDLLAKVDERILNQADGFHPDLHVALKHLLSSGGKRIRPAVVLLTGRMLGGEEEQLIILSGAVELLHTATLVHDDLIDGALLRRGHATLNSIWSPAATVLAGDFIFARSAKLVSEIESMPLMQLFAQVLSTIVNGEVTQLLSSRGVASRENYQQRIYAKTASLFELSALSAARISNVNAATVEKMRLYGYSIGMAFQIVDDVLDFTGEQATVGKPVASDLRQGLITLPALFYLENHPEDQEFKKVMAGSNSSEPLITQVISSIRESGAIERSLEEARKYIDRGLEALFSLPDSVYRQSLEQLASYIVARPL